MEIGILNYHGENWLAIELWVQQADGASVSLSLEAGTPVWTSLVPPETVYSPSWSKRAGAY